MRPPVHPPLDGRHTIRATFPAVAPSVAAARRFVSAYLARFDLDESAIADARLLVSELVTNAILHAGSPVVVSVEVDGEAVSLRVVDEEADALPRPRRAAPDSTSGRGLHIVGALADRWSVRRLRHGKSVRARLPRVPS